MSSADAVAARAVGVDLGGTKTHLMAVAPNGTRVERVLPSREWRVDSLFADPANLTRLADLVSGFRPLGPDTVTVVGAHGCDTPDACEVARVRLAERLAGTVHVVNDAALLAPAAGLERSIQLIVGTGAIVVGADAAGAMVRVGGHGWLFGDFGSAPALVREAMRAIVRRDSEGHPPDPLAVALMKRHGAPDVSTLAYALTDTAGETEWGGLATLFFAELDRGSPVARTVLEEAVEVLVADVVAAVRRGAVGDVVLAAGGVVTNQPVVATALRRRLAERLPDLTLWVLDVPPVHGAVNLALAGVG